MKTQFHIACFAALLGTSLTVAAASNVTIKLSHDGASEVIRVPLSELKVGESRQLAAESGHPAIVTRTEDGLSVEIGGRRTDVPLSRDRVDSDDRIRVVRMQADSGEPGERRIFISKGDTDRTEILALDREELRALIDDAEAGLDDGKVMIIRREKASISVD